MSKKIKFYHFCTAPSGKKYCFTTQKAEAYGFAVPPAIQNIASLAFIRTQSDYEDWKYLRDISPGQDFYVPAYFDTSDGKMDPECVGDIGSSITNNCNDKVKFSDHTLWTLQSGLDIKFEKDKSCIKFKNNYRFEDENCNGYLRLVVIFDCCKYNEIS